MFVSPFVICTSGCPSGCLSWSYILRSLTSILTDVIRTSYMYCSRPYLTWDCLCLWTALSSKFPYTWKKTWWNFIKWLNKYKLSVTIRPSGLSALPLHCSQVLFQSQRRTKETAEYNAKRPSNMWGALNLCCLFNLVHQAWVSTILRKTCRAATFKHDSSIRITGKQR